MHRAARLLVPLLALLALTAAPARASDNLDVSALLAERGTRLLVVEFYATWCGPCMAAMPRWKALKDKYAAQGLRIAVVNTQDPEGGCKALPFSPDVAVCDLEGRIANHFGIAGKLPSAFLWSWQGNLLVQRGHVDAVEREIERYLQQAPRVLLQNGDKAAAVPEAALAAVREALVRDGKVLVVAGADEQRAIDSAKRAQQDSRYDERATCQLGAELPPNTLLRVSKVGEGKQSYLNVRMVNLESGCTVQTGSAELSGNAAVAADDAVGKLLRKLRNDRVQMPHGAGAPGPVEPVKPTGPKVEGGAVAAGGGRTGPAVDGGEVTDAVGRLIVTVLPKEAVVEVKGPKGFRATGRGGWENARLLPGNYEVEATAEGFEAARQSALVRVDSVVAVNLALERLGSLEVVGGPQGARVEISGPDGFRIEKGLPVKVKDAHRGRYTVAVSKEGFDPERYEADVKNGERAEVRAQLLPLGSLVVEGTPVGAKVEIAGPDGFAVSKGLPVKVEGLARGKYAVRVSRGGYVVGEYVAEVRSGEASRVAVALARVEEPEAEPAAGPVVAEAPAPRRPDVTVVAAPSSGGGTGWLVAGGLAGAAAIGLAVWAKTAAATLQTQLATTNASGRVSGIGFDGATAQAATIDRVAYAAAGFGAVGAVALVVGLVKRAGAPKAVETVFALPVNGGALAVVSCGF